MRFRQIAKIVLFGLGSIAALGVTGVVVIHSYLRARGESAAAIRTPNGIEESGYVLVGGIKQWIQIRGENKNNPVLLFLHGGPGASSIPISEGFRIWERNFTVVQWDQRGAGRTYRKNSARETGPLSVKQMTADGLELTAYLRRYLHHDRIVLVGHSWGSALGIQMVKARPDMFSAFVGTGQVVDAEETERFNYAHVLRRAQDANNTLALAELAQLGPPPWSDLEKLKSIRRLGSRFAADSGDAPNPRANFSTPTLSLIDYYFWMKGPAFTHALFNHDLQSLNLRTLGTEFGVPIFFFQGTADQVTPIEPVEEYVAEIKAPHKELVRFEGDHHFVVFNRSQVFLDELVNRVLPQLTPILVLSRE